ncbi:MFS transporter [Acetobacteraceae bacterium KSS8]|uniref:MFS transporter n=1 Tax=Endosaccharibacter trunci TaxID=2812733 RepID=A0ABT1W3I3_9PROT|nr:MFS transporter [Acetobacteraceae bacterium KSS8]
MGGPAGADASQAGAATRAGLATRLVFLVAGFGLACWAPLVPFARQRLGVDDAALGLLLLCLGIGSVVSMLGIGAVCTRFGARPAILAGGTGMALVLPVLSFAATPAAMAAALFVFGAALGALDASMNVHAVEVERLSGRPMMSGFHALFSIGGFLGAGVMTVLLAVPLSPSVCAALCSIPMLIAMAVASARLLRGPGGEAGAEPGPLLVMPRGVVWLLAFLAAVTFLVEGAMLDWGALLLTGARLVPERFGGVGYGLFAMAMTAGRLSGDRLAALWGDRALLRRGGCVSLAGFGLLLSSPWPVPALAGFVLIGLGAANMVPVLFRRAGAQRAMPVPLAVSAVTSVGYAGVLAGPAAVGGIAHAIGLPGAFAVLAALLCTVPLLAGIVAGIGRKA